MELKKIKWTGSNTERNQHWKAEANTYRELFNLLENEGITHWEDLENLQLKNAGVKEDDLTQAELDEIINADITEEEYKGLILASDGVAYYQNIVEPVWLSERVAGGIIEEYDTLEEAIEALEDCETDDRCCGEYVPDFYDIIDHNRNSLL